jgi:hypothetical protein
MYPGLHRMSSFTKLPCVLLNVPALPFKKTFHAFYLLTFMMKIDCDPINFPRKGPFFFVFWSKVKFLPCPFNVTDSLVDVMKILCFSAWLLFSLI